MQLYYDYVGLYYIIARVVYDDGAHIQFAQPDFSKGIYNITKKTGVEDGIGYSSIPGIMAQNNFYDFQLYLIDVNGDGDQLTPSTVTADIYALHTDGEVKLPTTLIYKGGTDYKITTGEFPEKYCWLRDNYGNVKARLEITAKDNDQATHSIENLMLLTGVSDITKSGTFSTNEYWGGGVEITGDVTVPAGKTLTIFPNSNIVFKNNASFYSNGTLNIKGNSLIKNIFDFVSPGTNVNNGMKLMEGSNSHINNMLIKNAFRAIDLNQAYLNISDCEILGCSSHGINMYSAGSGSVISGCKIHDNTGTGIVMYYSSPLITNNTITNNYYGIAVADQSSPFLGEMGLYGNNKISSNRLSGITVTRNCSPFLGENICIENGGHNNIVDNATTNNGQYNIKVSSNSVVIAENNWWNFNIINELERYADPQYLFCDESSILDTYPTADPADNANLSIAANVKAKSPEESLFDDAFSGGVNNIPALSSPAQNSAAPNNVSGSISQSYNDQWPILKKLKYARYMVSLHNDRESEKICRDVIKNSPDSSLCFFALNILMNSAQKNNPDEFKSYLSQVISTGEDNLVSSMSKILLARFDRDNRIKMLDEVISGRKNANAKAFRKSDNDNILESALFSKLLYYCYDLKDMSKARAVVSEIDNLVQKGSPSSVEAHALIGEDISNILIKKGKSDSNDMSLQKPLEYSLQGNYPNPFNPTTKISYSLPMQSRVELKIYDTIGRELSLLVNAVQAPGKYDVIFNASGYPSGLYIYKIKAQSLENSKVFEKTAKMLLLK